MVSLPLSRALKMVISMSLAELPPSNRKTVRWSILSMQARTQSTDFRMNASPSFLNSDFTRFATSSHSLSSYKATILRSKKEHSQEINSDSASMTQKILIVNSRFLQPYSKTEFMAPAYSELCVVVERLFQDSLGVFIRVHLPEIHEEVKEEEDVFRRVSMREDKKAWR